MNKLLTPEQYAERIVNTILKAVDGDEAKALEIIQAMIDAQERQRIEDNLVELFAAKIQEDKA